VNADKFEEALGRLYCSGLRRFWQFVPPDCSGGDPCLLQHPRPVLRGLVFIVFIS